MKTTLAATLTLATIFIFLPAARAAEGPPSQGPETLPQPGSVLVNREKAS